MPVSLIPVENVYFLLSYAWDALPEAAIIDVARVPSNNLVDLYAFVQCGGVEHLARRGLERGYVSLDDELTAVRGRIKLLESQSRMLPKHGRLICEADELTPNTLPNQIIKATLASLARVSSIDSNLKRRMQGIRRGLSDINDIRLRASDFSRVQLHANHRYYRFLISVCKLVYEATLVDEKTGSYRFRDFLRDHKQMSSLFQRFICNFYRIERKDRGIRGEQIGWRVATRQKSALDYLPRMTTDVSLGVGEVKLIIDTKYYHETLSSYHEAQSVHSEHLYQLLAYLSNAEQGWYKRVEGMLLYPVVSTRLRLLYDELQGYRVRICTVDLAKNWQAVRGELLEILDWVAVGEEVGGVTYA